jgi:CheY-like chemotaxis protein
MSGRPFVLLVEDSREDAELAIAALEQTDLPAEIRVVHDGREALDYLHRRGLHSERAQGNPLFVLLDIKMPRLDGLQILEQLKSDALLRVVPVVMLSSSNEEKDVAQSYALGCNAFVIKHLEFDRFAEALRTLGKFWTAINQPPPGVLRDESSHDL